MIGFIAFLTDYVQYISMHMQSFVPLMCLQLHFGQMQHIMLCLSGEF